MTTTDMAQKVEADAGVAQRFARELRAVRRQGWGNTWGYVFIAPAVTLFMIFNLWPLLRGFLMAFTDYRFLFPDSAWDWVGLNNFKELSSDKLFWHALGTSIQFASIALPSIVIVALAVSVFISRVGHGAKIYRWLVYLPAIIPIACSMLMWRELYNNDYGYINNLLRSWGIQSTPNWLGSVSSVIPSIALAEVWRSFGFPTLLLLVGLYSINK